MNIRSAIVSFLSFLWNTSNTAGCPLKTSYFPWNWSFAMFFMIIAEQSQRYAGRIFSALATRWKKKAARTKEEPDSLSLSPLLSSPRGFPRRDVEWKKRGREKEAGRRRSWTRKLCPRDAGFIVCPPWISPTSLPFFSFPLFILFVGTLCLVGNTLTIPFFDCCYPLHDTAIHVESFQFLLHVNHSCRLPLYCTNLFIWLFFFTVNWEQAF